MTTIDSRHRPPVPFANLTLQEAADLVSAEIHALPRKEALRLNARASTVAQKALALAPRLRGFRADIVRSLPTVDPRCIDYLEVYAKALSHADLAWRTQPGDPSREPLVQDLRKVRAKWKVDLQPLVQKGLLDPEVLRQLKGRAGHQNLVFDIRLLLSLIRDRAKMIFGRSCIEREEVDRAESQANALEALLRAPSAERRDALAIYRRKAFTVFHRNYQKVRRAISFLRWFRGDLDKIAPTLGPHRQRPKKIRKVHGNFRKARDTSNR